MNCNDKLKCRKVPSVLRLFTPNKDKNYEIYAHHLLMLYYPFRKGSDLKSGSPPSYTNKLAEVDVLEIVNENRQVSKHYENDCRVLILGPTAVDSINVNGTASHFALN